MSVSMKRALGGVVTSCFLALGVVAATPAHAAAVDLSTWTKEGNGGTWTVAADKNSVTQSVNGSPTIFYSDYLAFGNQLSGTIRVNTTSDDDFIGFVVGFDPGELLGASTDFLLIDWKQTDQNSAGFANAGLALSHVTKGLPDGNGAWAHDPNFGVTELARGLNLHDTGWLDNTLYTFDIAYTASNIKVWVDGVLEFDVDGSFTNGRFGFYNYSQQNVTYAGIQNVVLPPPPGAVPEPATWGMMILGFAMAGTAMRRRRGAVTFA